jgi:AraC family transcriptional regulator, glycine betaine-responsive activator
MEQSAAQPATDTRAADWTEAAARTYGIFLLDGFDLQAFAGCVEALQLANSTSGRCHYLWTVVGEGSMVRSRSAIAVPAVEFAGVRAEFDRLVVVAGGAAADYANRQVLAWLRRVARAGASLCALEGGVWLLARAGLAKGRRMAVPWHFQAALQESFSDIDVAPERYLLGPGIASAVGGVAAFEMMVEWIRSDHGNALAEAVAMRQAATSCSAAGRSALGLAQRLRISNPHLIACLGLMEDHVEAPLDNGELATRVGVSGRHLERLFRQMLGTSPYQFYLRVRLERARRLVQQTRMTIMEIAMATGFVSASHFCRSFRETFGETPRRLRDNWCHTVDSGAANRLL